MSLSATQTVQILPALTNKLTLRLPLGLHFQFLSVITQLTLALKLQQTLQTLSVLKFEKTSTSLGVPTSTATAQHHTLQHFKAF